MRKLFLPAVACTLLLMFTGSAAAADIVYEVNLGVGQGSVTGSITTNGALGTLFNGDIVSFDLMLSVPPTTETLATPGDTVFIGPGGLMATPTELTFNFNASGTFVNFIGGASGCEPLLTLRGSGGTACNGLSGPAAGIALTDGSAASTTESGTVTIGAQQVTPAPEPASLAMIAVGLVSMIGFRRLRF